ncbi:sensor histidine kinase [Undibacterium baiyunense]|uniref:Histidine kinase n=1 Tax=Undibacterium baiyunense TaxID=2828731 RepID=A0A941I365_9BURK|nr:histidine kinase [Undibacterium baiyunense]MBR7746091.1 histidine kinase [Undibacterium baiyunense]
MNAQIPVESKRERLFHLGYLLFGINLPEHDQANASKASNSASMLKRSLLRIFLALMFALACVYVISSFGDFVSGFIAGWNSAGNADDLKFETWRMSQQLLLSLLAVMWFLTHNFLLKRAIAQTIARHDAERERANQLEISSTLKLLKAQIEPHFLFNTLGLVQHLAEPTAPQAAALTADLIQFLRATLESLRSDTISLEDDCKTCDAYLKIMQTRLPRRLSYEIRYEPQLQQFRLPSALLLTLVENAIKHGIEPAVNGGHISIVAHQIDQQIHITVIDTGLGFGEEIGHGLGLDHIRNRLTLSYGEKAKLVLEENEPRGVIARLVLPA